MHDPTEAETSGGWEEEWRKGNGAGSLRAERDPCSAARGVAAPAPSSARVEGLAIKSSWRLVASIVELDSTVKNITFDQLKINKKYFLRKVWYKFD